MKMENMLTQEFIKMGLSLGPLLLLIAIFVVLTALTVCFLLFCRRSRKFANRLEEYVHYILEDEKEEESTERIGAVSAVAMEDHEVHLSKGQQEELLQEILGGFLS